jgi:hypothetical protein
MLVETFGEVTMKGKATNNGKFLTLLLLTFLTLMTAACFTIVADGARRPDQSTDLTPQRPEVAGVSSVSDSPSPGQESSDSYKLKLSVDPGEGGTLVASPRPDGRGTYPAGTEVTIEVRLNPGWEIEQWIGPLDGISGDAARVNMDQDRTVLVRLVEID